MPVTSYGSSERLESNLVLGTNECVLSPLELVDTVVVFLLLWFVKLLS